jgi:two-component system, OmpR family, response regulator
VITVKSGGGFISTSRLCLLIDAGGKAAPVCYYLKCMENKILVVDDEKAIVEIIKAYLEKDGYRVITAFDGNEALRLARKERPDLIVLDLMLPGISGWDICRTLRKESNVPVIMLTARDDVTDKIIGLELGADDYVTKPFDPKELVSRVRAVLRRAAAQSSPDKKFLRAAGLVVDTERRDVRRGDKQLDLTPTEYDILKILIESPGRVFSRMQLLDKMQGDAYEGYERTVDSHIKNLRKKVEPDPDHPRYILTVHGIGYKMEDSANAPS